MAPAPAECQAGGSCAWNWSGRSRPRRRPEVGRPASVRAGPGELAPTAGLHADHEGVPAAALGPENRGFPLADLEPVLAEGVEDVRLVGHEHDVGSGGRGRRRESAERLGPAVVLVRRDHEAALGEVRRRLHLAEAEERAGLDRALEQAGAHLPDGIASLRIPSPMARASARPLSLSCRCLSVFCGFNGSVSAWSACVAPWRTTMTCPP